MKSRKVRSWRGGRAAEIMISGALVLAGGCGGGAEAPLSADERDAVARAYADSVRVLTPLADSACAADQPALTDYLVDSIYGLRLADIEAQQSVLE